MQVSKCTFLPENVDSAPLPHHHGVFRRILLPTEHRPGGRGVEHPRCVTLDSQLEVRYHLMKGFCDPSNLKEQWSWLEAGQVFSAFLLPRERPSGHHSHHILFLVSPDLLAALDYE